MKITFGHLPKVFTMLIILFFLENCDIILSIPRICNTKRQDKIKSHANYVLKYILMVYGKDIDKCVEVFFMNFTIQRKFVLFYFTTPSRLLFFFTFSR